jgi:hypothetical protein
VGAQLLFGDLAAGRFVPPGVWGRFLTPSRFLLAAPYLLFALPLSTPVAAGAAAVASVGFAATLLLPERLIAQYVPAGVAMVVMAVAALAVTAALSPSLRLSDRVQSLCRTSPADGPTPTHNGASQPIRPGVVSWADAVPTRPVWQGMEIPCRWRWTPRYHAMLLSVVVALLSVLHGVSIASWTALRVTSAELALPVGAWAGTSTPHPQ